MILALILATGAVAAAPPAVDPPDNPAADLAALQQLYDQSCGSRAYATYDDICIQITQQLKEAERNAARHPRKPAAAKPQPKPE